MTFFKTLDESFLFFVSSAALQKRQENSEALLERQERFARLLWCGKLGKFLYFRYFG